MLMAGGRIIGSIPFPKVLTLWEMQSWPGFELVSPCPFPITLFIALRAPPSKYIYYTKNMNDFLKVFLKEQQISFCLKIVLNDNIAEYV